MEDGTHHYGETKKNYNNRDTSPVDSEIFNLVVDPFTDFKIFFLPNCFKCACKIVPYPDYGSPRGSLHTAMTATPHILPDLTLPPIKLIIKCHEDKTDQGHMKQCFGERYNPCDIWREMLSMCQRAVETDYVNIPSSPRESYNLTPPETPRANKFDYTNPNLRNDNLEETVVNQSSRTSSSLSLNSTSTISSSPQIFGRTLLHNFIAEYTLSMIFFPLWDTNCCLKSVPQNSIFMVNPFTASSIGDGINDNGYRNHNRIHQLSSAHPHGSALVLLPNPHLSSTPRLTMLSHLQQKSSMNKPPSIHESCDALVALREASSTLGVTETLIGPPLRIPCITSEASEKIASKMENVTGLPNKSSQNTTNTTNAPVQLRSETRASSANATSASTSTTMSADYALSTSLTGNASTATTPTLTQGASSPTQVLCFTLKFIDSHQCPNFQRETHLSYGDIAKMEFFGLFEIQDRDLTMPKDETKSHTISVPVGMTEQGPIQVYKEVHKYPVGSISTTVERKSYIGLEQTESKLSSRTKKKLKSIKKSKKKDDDHYTSQLSLASGVSEASKVSGMSGLSGGTYNSTGSTEKTGSSGPKSCITRSRTSSRTSINDNRSEQVPGLKSRPALSSAIAKMRQAMENKSMSDNASDVMSVFSDTSSNLSNLSDLSGYEDEYMRIKRLVSDVAHHPTDELRKMVIKGSHKPQAAAKPQPSIEQEKTIRDLQAQKEDLEIHLHRMSIQVQNSVREKELYQQQIELMQTKITETNQKQYFEVLKQRAALEGQLEMIKQELENSVYEKSQVQTKLNQALKDSQSNQAATMKAKEAESSMDERLKKMEGDYKILERKIEETKEELQKSHKDQERTEEEFKVLSSKNLQLEEAMEQKVSKENQLTGDNQSLNSRILELQKDVDVERQLKIKAESNIRKLNSDLETANKSRVWYQEQLQAAQSARTTLQQELLEIRSQQTSISQERDALDAEVKSLKLEAEEGRARLVREKASLVSHLEALQADMAEREAAVAQIEKERGVDSKLLEERRQKLERDRQRMHNMRLDLSDAERVIEDQRIDLKKKMSLLMRYEAELKKLRTTNAVDTEVLCERDVTIQNQKQSIAQMEALLKKTQDEVRSRNSLIASLSEEKMKVETALAAAYAEKKEVDEGIAKFKEDMSKLSSNFYRMKHDIAAKDRQIEALKRESQESKQLKDDLNMKIQEQEAQIINDEEKKNLNTLLETMKEEEKKTLEEKGKVTQELNILQQNIRMIEIEKKGLSEAVQLREEQIQNLQNSIENYRESMLKKDEELFISHEKYSGIEKNYIEICKNYETFKNENLALKQETEAYIENEKLIKREMSEMKENVYKERKLKQSLEKKIELIEEKNDEKIDKLKMEKENLSSHINELNDKFTNDSAAFEERITSYIKEIQVLKDDKLRMEKKCKDINAAIKQSDEIKSTAVARVKSLEASLQEISKENRQLKENILGLKQQEGKVLELENCIKTNEKEIDNHKASLRGLKSQIAKVNQEKINLSSQISTLTTANNELKQYKTEELSLKSNNDKKCRERSPEKGKGSRSSEQSKEYNSLQKKLAEAEARVLEVMNKNESIDMALKNTKKESSMMKAKLKDYESLKNKNQEMDCSNEKFKKINIENDLKLKEFEEKLKEEENCRSDIELKASEYCNHISSLEKEKREFVVQMQNLETRTEELKEKIINLEEEITQKQLELHLSQEERDQWAAKYQSLRDYIPERDTSTQPAVQLENTPFSGTQQQPSIESATLREGGSSSIATPSSSPDIVHSVNDLNLYLSPVTKGSSVDNGAQFERTMSDLQRQVNLTSEALQNKESQIQGLVQQVTALKLKEREEENINSEGSNKTEPLREYNITNILDFKNKIIQIYNMIDSRGHHCKCSDVGRISKDIIKTFEGIEENSEVQNLLSQIETFKSQLSANETLLEERRVALESSATEFREKQRRYESNVRLLTRKLKEHMKGRKAAEKTLQEEAQQNQRLMDEERIRYESLKKR
ncbi:unnamed protein product, partial [Meganyctiphanes norvegica]